MTALTPERLAYERAKLPPEKPRSRLTIQDFKDKGIDVVDELWKGLQAIENPVEYMKCFLAMLRFVCPQISAIDIQHEVQTSGTQTVDLSGVPSSKLLDLLKLKKD